MIHILKNEYIKIEIADKGAELQSIFHKENRTEYLWQGELDFWPRKAPVLFPIVGKLKENSFIYEGKSYSLPQHGFARDKKFEIVKKTDTDVVFRLTQDEETLKNFPFNFILDIHYSIQNNQLDIRYSVHNPDKEKNLFFSIGAHPGFRCPLKENEKFEDYYLEFEKNEQIERILLDGGLRSNTTEAVMLNNNTLPLTEGLFGIKDAIVVKNLKSERISLKSSKHNNGLHFNFKGYPWFGIWSKPGPFVCLEPWIGVADDIYSDQQFVSKEAIQKLAPGEMSEYSYSIELF